MSEEAKQKKFRKKMTLIDETDNENENLIKKEKLKNKQSGISKKEVQIRMEEYKKSKINEYLLKKLGDNIVQDQIKTSNWWSRLIRAPPKSLEGL